MMKSCKPEILSGRRSYSSQQKSKRDTLLFKKKLESIRDYLDLLENDPEKAKATQNNWEKHFYKYQLKGALSINYYLVKLMEEKEQQIQDLLVQISQLKKKHCKFPHSIQPQFGQDQNRQIEVNRMINTPKKLIEKAYQAEKKILGAKYSKEKQQYKKMMQRKEQILQSNKEENGFLREKLISLGEKLSFLQQQNRNLRNQNNKLLGRKTILADVAKQVESIDGIQGRVLNFSPISNREEDNQIQMHQISFNQFQTTPADQDICHLQQQVQKLKNTIKTQQNELQFLHGQLKENVESFHQNIQVKNDSQKKQLEIAEQVRQKDKQKSIEYGVKTDKFEVYRNKSKLNEIPENLESESEADQLCQSCSKLLFENRNLRQQLQSIKKVKKTLQMKIEAMMKFEKNQHQQWDSLIYDIDLI